MDRTAETTDITAAQKARAALQALEDAWAYFTPTPKPAVAEAAPEQEPFQYHNAA